MWIDPDDAPDLSTPEYQAKFAEPERWPLWRGLGLAVLVSLLLWAGIIVLVLKLAHWL